MLQILWKKLCHQLPITKEETQNYKKEFKKMFADKNEIHHQWFSHLYKTLSILDNKSSSLLAYNSIIMAIFAIFMTNFPTRQSSPLIISGLICLLTSSVFLLTIIWVHWSKKEDLIDSDKHVDILLYVRRCRTIRYRVAWILSSLAMILLFFFLLWKFFSLFTWVLLGILLILIVWVIKNLLKLRKEFKNG